MRREVRFLPSDLPPAEMGTAQQEFPVTTAHKAILIYVVINVVVGIPAALIGARMLDQLDQATAHQCITHDWPAAAHQIHMDWCADNGYDT